MSKASHSIETSEEGGVRFLHFGSEWVQGAMRIARPYALELEYTREMMGCLLLRGDPDWPKSVLQIGLGAASLTKFLHRHGPATRQTVVEINPDVVAMAVQSFKLPLDAPNIDIQIADGVGWMKQSKAKFDCIMVDGYDHNARFGALGSEDFYRDCRARLSKRGVLVLNLFGRAHGYRAQLDYLRAAFDDRVLALPPVEGGNAIAFAVVGERAVIESQCLRDEAQRVYQATGLKLMATVARIEQAVVAAGNSGDRSSKRAGGRGRPPPEY
jgi:spermidine synthase